MSLRNPLSPKDRSGLDPPLTSLRRPVVLSPSSFLDADVQASSAASRSDKRDEGDCRLLHRPPAGHVAPLGAG